jgi:phosphoribosylformimino-5-aminoimidazole carboxamide ribotide isomerase
MKLFPAIDLLGGRAVRLEEGKRERVTVFHDRPAELIAELARDGADRLHVVDLDGAFGEPRQLALIAALVAASPIPVEVGGGIRDRAAIERWLALGIDRVVLGTAALRDPKLVRDAASDHPGRIIVGIDARAGFVAVEGWVETTDLGVVELGRRYADCGVAAIVYTDIARDGALCGIDVKGVAEVARQVRLPVIASGGVASLEDIAALKACEADGIAGVICGRALYDGRIDPAAALSLLAEERPC